MNSQDTCSSKSKQYDESVEYSATSQSYGWVSNALLGRYFDGESFVFKGEFLSNANVIVGPEMHATPYEIENNNIFLTLGGNHYAGVFNGHRICWSDNDVWTKESDILSSSGDYTTKSLTTEYNETKIDLTIDTEEDNTNRISILSRLQEVREMNETSVASFLLV